MSTHRKRTRWVGNVVVLALLALWFVLLAPTAIGGSTSYVQVFGNSMDGTYATGDLILQRKHDTYRVGDVVTFDAGGGQVIHRIIGGNGETGYITQGDNNPEIDPWRPTDEQVVGRSWLRIPGGGRLLELPREPWFAALAAGLGTLAVLSGDEVRKRRPGHTAASHPKVDALAGAPQ